MTVVGFYAHHHGAGHLQRCRAVGDEILRKRPDWSTSIASTGSRADDVRSLPTDVPDGPTMRMLGRSWFHWAPDVPSVQAQRMHALADWVLADGIDFVVVDVSAEVAVSMTLMGVPTAVVRLHGDRSDRPHRLAFDIADLVLAPFPERLEHESTPAPVLDRTVHAGLVGTPGSQARAESHPDDVAVVWGTGSSAPTPAALDAAARAVPSRRWHYIGPGRSRHDCVETLVHGWVASPAAFLSGNVGIAVGPCGDGVLADVAGAGVRFAAIPQPRPFDEQVHKAQVLAREGLAVHVARWPDPSRWSAILDDVATTTAPGSVLDVDGASVMADAIIDHLTASRREAAA